MNKESVLDLVASQPIGTFCSIGVSPDLDDDEGVLLRKIESDKWAITDPEPSYNGLRRTNAQVVSLIKLYNHPWSFS